MRAKFIRIYTWIAVIYFTIFAVELVIAIGFWLVNTMFPAPVPALPPFQVLRP